MTSRNTTKRAWSHFQQRLQERYGIDMQHHEYMALNEQTTNGHKDHYVGRTSRHSTWWVVDYKDARILALYSPKYHRFLTVLPISKLDKALEGHTGYRKYFGITDESVMLRRHNARKPIQVVEPATPAPTPIPSRLMGGIMGLIGLAVSGGVVLNQIKHKKTG